MKVGDLIKELKEIDKSKEVFILDKKERVYTISTLSEYAETIGLWIEEKK